MKDCIGSELRKFVAPEFIFGNESRFKVAQYTKKLGGTNVLIVTDSGILKAGWVKDIQDSLESENISYTIFHSVTPNPREFEVMLGAKTFNESECDFIIAIGGGSPMDCAKGIAIVTGNGGHILEYEGVDKVAKPGPPLICVPTTAGTAADVSQFSIIGDMAKKNKIAIISKAIIPDVSLIDPVTTTSMDNYLTACTGIDALTHAIEAYASNAHSLITDIHALKAIELIIEYLPRVIANPGDLVFREYMALGCLEAGLAFSNASLGAVHAMAHSLGGYLDLPHGQCNAILLNHVMRFNFPEAKNQFDKVAGLFKLDIANMDNNELREYLCQAVFNLRVSVGIDQSLKDIGVKTADIPELADHAINDPCLLTNPRKVNKRDIEVIYEEAF